MPARAVGGNETVIGWPVGETRSGNSARAHLARGLQPPQRVHWTRTGTPGIDGRPWSVVRAGRLPRRGADADDGGDGSARRRIGRSLGSVTGDRRRAGARHRRRRVARGGPGVCPPPRPDLPVRRRYRAIAAVAAATDALPVPASP